MEKNKMEDKDETLDEQKKCYRKGKISVFFSLLLGLIPWLVILYFSRQASELVAALGIAGYWYTFGIPILITAIMFAHNGIKYTKKTKNKYYYLSIIVLILSWSPIISLFILIFIQFMQPFLKL